MTVTVYDWPASVAPAESLFHAPGAAIEGAYTGGGAVSLSPEPGGRAFIEMRFSHLKTHRDMRLASWLISMVANGTVWRVPLYNSPQLVPLADLGVDASVTEVPWEALDGSDVLWDGGVGWGVDVEAPAAASALAGSAAFTLNLANCNQALLPGHAIGHDNRAYKVMGIVYDDDELASVTVSPPLRTPIVAGDRITLRPSMLGRVRDVSMFRALFEYGLNLRPGGITFVEALV